MPRWPRGLHAQGVRNTGGRARRPAVLDQEEFTQHVRAPINNGIAQGIIANNGHAILSLGPQGVGTRWYPSEVLVSTTSGPADQSACVLYRQFIDPKQLIGRTEQGGGDTLAFTREMQPGDLILAHWSRANPGDLATITMHGDQIALIPP